jgi:small subunit ribosomal protein S3
MASERKFIAENIRRVLLKEYLMKEVSRAGFGGVEVQRTPMGTRVTLTTERPGIVIGRRGSAIKNLTRAIEDDFNFDNPQIEVQEVGDPNLNPQIMAEKLAFALERGWHFRRAGHSTVRRIMESGAKGCQVVLAGKLTGQRHRTEKFKNGYIKFCGEPRLQFIKTGFAVATLKRGVIGVKVEIMDPEARLPDEVSVLTPTQAKDLLPDLFAEIEAREAAERVTAYETSGAKTTEDDEEETPSEEAEEPQAEDAAVESVEDEPAEETPSEEAEEPQAEDAAVESVEDEAEGGKEEEPETVEEAESEGSEEVKE